MSEIEMTPEDSGGQPGSQLPVWGRAVLSLLLIGHLLAVFCLALAAPSGPWPVQGGADMASPPQFATTLLRRTPWGSEAAPEDAGTFDWTLMGYLSLLKMTHNYHFVSNRPDEVGTHIEAKLRDAEGEVVKTVMIPDENANSMTYHRQSLLAKGLTDDVIVEPPPGEFVPAPDQPIETARIWRGGEGRTASIEQVQVHLVPRGEPVFGPSDWSMVLARSYARHLCREHQAASVEIVRHTKPAIPPDVLFMDAPPQAGTFDESIMTFGVFNASSESN